MEYVPMGLMSGVGVSAAIICLACLWRSAKSADQSARSAAAAGQGAMSSASARVRAEALCRQAAEAVARVEKLAADLTKPATVCHPTPRQKEELARLLDAQGDTGGHLLPVGVPFEFRPTQVHPTITESSE